MTQPLPEGRLPELDSETACMGSHGFYLFRLRCWQDGEAGGAKFMSVPLLLDPLEVEREAGLLDTPKFWDTFDLAYGQASPEQRELMGLSTPLTGSLVRECARIEHEDGKVRYAASPRFEAAARWAVVERLGDLALSLVPSRVLRLDDEGIGEAWLVSDGEETVRVVAGDVTPDEWLRTRRSLTGEDPHVMLAQSIVGSYVRIVLHQVPLPVPNPDGSRGTVEQLVHIRGSEDLPT